MRGPPPVCHLKEWPLHGAPLDTSLSFPALFHTRSLSLGLPKEGLSGPTCCSHLDTSSCHLSSQPLTRAPLPARGPSSVFFHRLVKKHHGPFLTPPPPKCRPLCACTPGAHARTHTHLNMLPSLHGSLLRLRSNQYLAKLGVVRHNRPSSHTCSLF